MATVENRSRFIVKITNRAANRHSLTKEFTYDQEVAAEAYYQELKKKYPNNTTITRADDAFLVRIRQTGYKAQCTTFSSFDRANQYIKNAEAERTRGLIIDYTKGRKFKFSDLVERYIREECPKHKGFESTAYRANAMLADAGCEEVDINELIRTDTRLTNIKQRNRGGMRMREPSSCLHWMAKRFADIEPDDINGYIQDRLQSVSPATVDRELDLISAICKIAIKSWRIPVAQSPMDGVIRPKYFNERDRRLRMGEYEKLLEAARQVDRERAIEVRLNELVMPARKVAATKATTKERKLLITEARLSFANEAAESYKPVPLYDAFVQFQTMTAARRGEALGLKWSQIDFDEKTAFLPETKNGRPRKLSLRAELIEILRVLKRADLGEQVFPFSIPVLCKVWRKVCDLAGLVDLNVHDLRHEAISLVAETGHFSLVDLQAFSGHRDVRMLMRYAHLCAKQLATRLDEAFNKEEFHKGRKRLLSGGPITIADVILESCKLKPANEATFVGSPERSMSSNSVTENDASPCLEQTAFSNFRRAPARKQSGLKLA